MFSFVKEIKYRNMRVPAKLVCYAYSYIPEHFVISWRSLLSDNFYILIKGEFDLRFKVNL